MARIAIMQGRLVPPEDGIFQCFPLARWREEFSLAAEAGLDAIEWIYDLRGEAHNPVGADEGLFEIRRLSEEHGIAVVSMCADYFMDRPLASAGPDELEERVAKLSWLLDRCRLAGIGRVVLPFVDNSRIQSAEQEERVVNSLRRVLPWAENTGVELHLETSLDPCGFAALLAELPHPYLRVNYDSGNSSSLGYDVREELAAYGDRIGSVHIKDRIRGGGTVPLGTGDADIPALLSGLAAIGYQGDFVLQAARSEAGKELEWARRNITFLRSRIERACTAVRGGSL